MSPSSADVSAAPSDDRAWYETLQGQRVGMFAAGALGTMTLVLVGWVALLKPAVAEELPTPSSAVEDSVELVVTDRFAGTFQDQPVYFALAVADDGSVAGSVERLGAKLSGSGKVSATGFEFSEEGTGYIWRGALVAGTIRGQVSQQGLELGPFAVRP